MVTLVFTARVRVGAATAPVGAMGARVRGAGEMRACLELSRRGTHVGSELT